MTPVFIGMCLNAINRAICNALQISEASHRSRLKGPFFTVKLSEKRISDVFGHMQNEKKSRNVSFLTRKAEKWKQ